MIIGVKSMIPRQVAKASALELSAAVFVFLTGEKCSCQCTQGNMANLQKYKASEKDRSCKSQKTSTEILTSYSSVSTILYCHPACAALGFNSCTWLFFFHEGRKKKAYHVGSQKTLFCILIIP